MTTKTDLQAAFVVAYVVNGGNATQAARDAGYSETSARQVASQLLGKPHVQEAIRKEQQRTISGPLCSKALRVLEGVLDDKDAPYGARVDAAKTLLDRGGFAAKGAGQHVDPATKSLSEMTVAELQAVIAEERGRLVAREH